MNDSLENQPFGPLPEDRDLSEETINSAPQVQEADQIMRTAAAKSAASEKPVEPPAALEQRVFDLDQIPELTSEALEKSREIYAQLELLAKNDAVDVGAQVNYRTAKTFVKNLERMCADLQKTDSEAQRRYLTDRILDDTEVLSSFLPQEEKSSVTRWPGTKVHESKPDENQPDSYERSIRELPGAVVPVSEESNELNKQHDTLIKRLQPSVREAIQEISPRLQALKQIVSAAGPESPLGQAFSSAQQAREKLLRTVTDYLNSAPGADEEEIMIDITKVRGLLEETEDLAGR